MRKEELLFDALGEIDPALLVPPEKADITDTAAGTPSKGRKIRLRFAAVFAAALLLIAGVSAGAPYLSARMRTETAWNTSEGNGEDFIYRMRIEEWNGFLELSDEVMETLESLEPLDEEVEVHTAAEMIEKGCVIPFDTWSDAAEWLDCGLLVPSQADSQPADYRRLYVQYLDGSNRNIRCVNITGSHPAFSSKPYHTRYCHIYAKIPLSEETWKIYSGGLSDKFNALSEPEETVFLNPLGDEVRMVSVCTQPSESYTGDLRWDVSANFIHEGIIYSVRMSCPDREEAEDTVMKVVNSMK